MRSSFPASLASAVLLAIAGPALAVQPSLGQVLHAPTRTPAFVARDPARHPSDELAFLGVTPGASVVEIWPGGGYWTEILASYLHASGTYRIALPAPAGGHLDQAMSRGNQKLLDRLHADPATYGRVLTTELGEGHDDIAPPGSADVVLTFRNLHNWLEQGDAPEMLAAIHRALKPGGILGIEDHRGNASQPQDPRASNGYVRQRDAVALVERTGFTLVGSSEMDANPKDTTNWPHGVWSLPPTLAGGQADRAKYVTIGEADNFVLKFRSGG